MRKNTAYLLFGISAVVLALAAFLYLRYTQPPEIARMLPECDAVAYFNLKPLRAVTSFDRTQITRSASYQQFIDATGIQPERDLDEAAFAINRMADPTGPNGAASFSEVFKGHFDSQRLAGYLAASAQSQEFYSGHAIYEIPSDGRTLRVVMLDRGLIGASNAPTTEQIHSLIDRSHPFRVWTEEPSILSTYFRQIPSFSSAWAIGHVALPFSEDGDVSVAGLRLPISAESTLVVSVRFTENLRLKIDDLTSTRSDAERSAEELNNLLKMAGALAPPASKSAYGQLLASIHVEPLTDRVSVEVALPYDLVHRLTSAPGL